MAHRFGRVMMHLVEQHCGVKEILALKDTIAEYEKEFGYPENVEDEDYDEDERGD
jgi:hypothetical protein